MMYSKFAGPKKLDVSQMLPNAFLLPGHNCTKIQLRTFAPPNTEGAQPLSQPLEPFISFLGLLI